MRTGSRQLKLTLVTGRSGVAEGEVGGEPINDDGGELEVTGEGDLAATGLLLGVEQPVRATRIANAATARTICSLNGAGLRALRDHRPDLLDDRLRVAENV